MSSVRPFAFLAVCLFLAGCQQAAPKTTAEDAEAIKKVSNARKTTETLFQICELYKGQNGQYPDTFEDLATKPEGDAGKKWSGPYVFDGKLPKDPWGQNYVIERSGEKVLIFSTGPDGKAKTADDVIRKEEAAPAATEEAKK
ncbi:MAG: type II secretion system protein GspG [Planctomycetota bacterium]